MKKKVTPYHLGGTLFVPATHKHLESIALNEKFSQLQSMVIDTEDGMVSDEIESALLRVEKLLQEELPSKPLRFIRPTNIEVLKRVLALQDIEKIDGFILPKFDLNVDDYLQIMESNSFSFMPSIEGKALFDREELKRIRSKLLEYQERIICIRFGAEDMLKQLQLQRTKELSLYDMLLPSSVISQLLMIFKPYGFELSAPVYKFYEDEVGFKKELLYELQNGFVSKTIIHPNQIRWLQEVYRVDKKELEKAEKILQTQSVGSFEGEMLEKRTQQEYAKKILLRRDIYNKLFKS